ncbi:transcriptional regulator, TetR family [Catenulispora acidiphila DSM 44928]|uniref:Transcriptional regulator, TetR family n=1 Tax=Catenulispora acidiphila (strain DSM 44928 / JCM 14897 / NBRC 102108 / NRRL B-24433 / ID139908) TaxID=479433 RepID=C7Q3U8_CATAD|nr:transcriptional regulator, TetR family [Catenulispora acidiphila DSM 44928]
MESVDNDTDDSDPGFGSDSPAPPLASVWTRPQRRQKEQLSRERIVAEAIALLDADGIEALSMRSLGQRLGAGATSLYRHVANKDELIELVVDEVYGEMDVPEVTDPASWRLALHITAHSLRRTGLRHMWLMSVLGQVGLNYLGPNVVDVTRRGLAIMTTAGFDMQEATKAMSSVSSYVIGITSAEAGWLMALRRQGYSEREWYEKVGPQMADSAIDPALAEVYLEQLAKDPREARAENFAYGLDLMLDSLQARLTAKLAAGVTGPVETAASQ